MNEDPYSFLPVAYRAASQVLRCRLLAEEAGERAVHLFTLAVLQGSAPEFPKAWLRSVARRTALALLRSDWAKQRPMAQEDLARCQAPYRVPRAAGIDFVRENLPPALSPRQRQAFAAAVTCNSTRAAARSCGMQPRDFRRSLGSISRKGRALLADRAPVDPFADNPAVQFQLNP
jgi:DNA-directed RNA polymerase specialized sigma24 family protein